jgi:hypothetical protein
MRLIDADALIAETMKNRCADCDRRKGIKQGKTTFVYDFGEAPCRACDVGDMIDTLDEATTICGWISVKDRMPDKNGQYLCWFGKNKIAKGAAIATYLEMWKSFGLLESLETYPNVTHWMPLPEPPKEDKDDD